MPGPGVARVAAAVAPAVEFILPSFGLDSDRILVLRNGTPPGPVLALSRLRGELRAPCTVAFLVAPAFETLSRPLGIINRDLGTRLSGYGIGWLDQFDAVIAIPNLGLSPGLFRQAIGVVAQMADIDRLDGVMFEECRVAALQGW